MPLVKFDPFGCLRVKSGPMLSVDAAWLVVRHASATRYVTATHSRLLHTLEEEWAPI